MRSSKRKSKKDLLSTLRVWLNRKFSEIRGSFSNLLDCQHRTTTITDGPSLSSGAEENDLSSGSRRVSEVSYQDASTQTDITMSDCATQVDETMLDEPKHEDAVSHKSVVSQPSEDCLDSLVWHLEFVEEAEKVCLALKMYTLEPPPCSTGTQQAKKIRPSRIPILACPAGIGRRPRAL